MQTTYETLSCYNAIVDSDSTYNVLKLRGIPKALKGSQNASINLALSSTGMISLYTLRCAQSANIVILYSRRPRHQGCRIGPPTPFLFSFEDVYVC